MQTIYKLINYLEVYFKNLYNKILNLGAHPNALKWLWIVSIVDSFFFPIPPLVMLIPMMLTKPKNSFNYAFATTAGSLIGGICGYYLGYAFFETVAKPFLHIIGADDKFNCLKVYYELYGWLAVLIWGFLPVPYKIITIASGFLKMPLITFLFASAVGRSIRYFGIGALFYYFGDDAKKFINKHFTIFCVGLALVLIIVAIVLSKLNPINKIC